MKIAPCNGIQDSVGLWILRSRYHIPGSGFRIVCQWNLDSGFQSLVGFQIRSDVFRTPKPRIPDSTSKNFLDSGRFRNPDSLIWGERISLDTSISTKLIYFQCLIENRQTGITLNQTLILTLPQVWDRARVKRYLLRVKVDCGELVRVLKARSVG